MSPFNERLDKFVETDIAEAIFHLSKRYKKRPSEIAGYTDWPPYKQILFDIAIIKRYDSNKGGRKPVKQPTVEEVVNCKDEIELLKLLGIEVDEDDL